MRLTDRFKKAVGLWPPKAPYITLRRAISRSGDVDTLPALLRSYPDAVRWEEKGDMQPLAYALWQGNFAAAEILIEHDNSILKDATPQGVTLLHKYARQGDEAQLRFLVRQGANCNAQDHSGQTALHHAAQSIFSTESIATLLKYGARDDITNKDGHTPLMCALRNGRQQAAAILLKKNTNPHETDPRGYSLLMMAAQSGLYDAVDGLLRAGADPTVKTPTLMTALGFAIGKKHARVAHLLVEASIAESRHHGLAAPEMPEMDDKMRKKLGNLIRPLENSEPALRSLGLRPSPKNKSGVRRISF